MAVPVDYFQPESFQQANPMLSGVQAAQQIFSQGAQNAFLPQNLQAQLQSAQLKNAMMQTQNQYLPQQLQSKIGLMQAQIPLAQAQTQETQARIPLENAQAWQIKNFPVQGDISGQMAYLNYIGQTQGVNSQQYLMQKEMLQTQMQRAAAMAAYYGSNTQYKYMTSPVKNAMVGQGAPVGTSAPLPSFGAPSASSGPQPSQPNGTQPVGNTAAFGVNYNTPLLQKTGQVATNQALTTNAQKNRLQAGQAVETFLNQPDIQRGLATLANYSGYEGMAKAQWQRLTDPQSYLQYQNANEQLPTIIAGGLKVLEGYPSTDQAVQRVTGYFKAAQQIAGSNPAAAAAYIQQGLKYIKDENAALQQVNQPIFKTGNIYSSQSQNNPSSPLDQLASKGLQPNGTTKVLNGKTYTKVNGQWHQQ